MRVMSRWWLQRAALRGGEWHVGCTRARLLRVGGGGGRVASDGRLPMDTGRPGRSGRSGGVRKVREQVQRARRGSNDGKRGSRIVAALRARPPALARPSRADPSQSPAGLSSPPPPAAQTLTDDPLPPPAVLSHGAAPAPWLAACVRRWLRLLPMAWANTPFTPRPPRQQPRRRRRTSCPARRGDSLWPLLIASTAHAALATMAASLLARLPPTGSRMADRHFTLFFHHRTDQMVAPLSTTRGGGTTSPANEVQPFL